MSWCDGLILLFGGIAALGFLCTDWPRRLQHRKRRPTTQHHSYFASTKRDYAE